MICPIKLLKKYQNGSRLQNQDEIEKKDLLSMIAESDQTLNPLDCQIEHP